MHLRDSYSQPLITISHPPFAFALVYPQMCTISIIAIHLQAYPQTFEKSRSISCFAISQTKSTAKPVVGVESGHLALSICLAPCINATADAKLAEFCRRPWSGYERLVILVYNWPIYCGRCQETSVWNESCAWPVVMFRAWWMYGGRGSRWPSIGVKAEFRLVIGCRGWYTI